MSQTESRLLSVFLCHSSEDKPLVRELYQLLMSDGLDPWLDEEKMEAGQDWKFEISKAVRNADIVIVCLSCSSITKTGYVQREIKEALDVADQQPEGSIFLIPLRLEPCDVPERLQQWHWVNFFEDTGYKKLLRALQKKADQLGLTLRKRRPLSAPEALMRPITLIANSPHPFIAGLEKTGSDFEIGQAVRIATGPLKDVEGVVIGLKSPWRVALSVPLLQRSVAVEIDSASVVALSTRA